MEPELKRCAQKLKELDLKQCWDLNVIQRYVARRSSVIDVPCPCPAATGLQRLVPRNSVEQK